MANRGTKNLVVFSTYQSLEIISKAQNGKKNPLSEFDHGFNLWEGADTYRLGPCPSLCTQLPGVAIASA